MTLRLLTGFRGLTAPCVCEFLPLGRGRTSPGCIVLRIAVFLDLAAWAIALPQFDIRLQGDVFSGRCLASYEGLDCVSPGHCRIPAVTRHQLADACDHRKHYHCRAPPIVKYFTTIG